MTDRRRIRVAGVVFLGMAAWLMLRALPVSSKDDLQFDRQRAQAMLDLTTAELEKNYYDPTMHGLNWTALKEDARAKIQTATSNGQMLGIVFGLVDKLQDSHTIFIAPVSSRATTSSPSTASAPSGNPSTRCGSIFAC